MAELAAGHRNDLAAAVRPSNFDMILGESFTEFACLSFFLFINPPLLFLLHSFDIEPATAG